MSYDYPDGAATIHIYPDAKGIRWQVKGEQASIRKAICLLLEAGKHLAWELHILTCGCKFTAPVFGEPVSACSSCFGDGKYPYINFCPVGRATAHSWQKFLASKGFEVVPEPLDLGREPDEEAAYGRVAVFLQGVGKAKMQATCMSHTHLVERWLLKAQMPTRRVATDVLELDLRHFDDATAALVARGCVVTADMSY